MTTKLRIIIGFTAMVVLIAIVATLGYRGLGVSSSAFDEYRRLARFNVISSEMTTEMNRGSAGLFSFVATDEAQSLQNARKNFEKLIALYKEAGQYVELEERRRDFNQIGRASCRERV